MKDLLEIRSCEDRFQNNKYSYVFYSYMHKANEYLNLCVEEAFHFYFDHLNDWHDKEDFLRMTLRDFFVDRFAKEECLNKVRAVYDLICSNEIFYTVKPIYEYILYCVIEYYGIVNK